MSTIRITSHGHIVRTYRNCPLSYENALWDAYYSVGYTNAIIIDRKDYVEIDLHGMEE